jgi:hypothetical protein
MVQGSVELVHRVGPEGVADLRSVEGDPHRSLFNGSVVSDVIRFKTFDRLPTLSIE